VAPLLGGHELLHTWLRPALTRADAAEPLLGGSWSRHRILAIRCMALLTSVEPEVASTHWPFFLSLLRRFGSRTGREAEIISQTCAMFLSDVLLLHSGASEWFPDPAAKSAALLAALRKAQAVSPPLRRKLSEKIAMMMLYGADREITMESTWALTSMMLEVFHHPAGKPSAEVADAAKLDLEEAEEAAHRGRLLCFFGCLGRASASHAARLGAAAELLLSTDLWHLAVPRPLTATRGAQTWRYLQLPRLLRLVCQQLAASCAGHAGRPAARHSAAIWLERVWRPLALLCLDVREESLLAELLRAAIVPVQAVDRSFSAPFTAAGDFWPFIAREVSEACQEISAAWSKGSSKASGEDLQPILRKLTECLGTVKTDQVSSSSPRWDEVREATRERRLQLRQDMDSLEIDISDLIAHALHAEGGLCGGRKRRCGHASDDDSGEVPAPKRLARTLFLGRPGGS